MENNTADKKMQGRIATIDELLEKDCYIIDFLPETVSKDSNGQFFDVEYYLLNSQKYHMIKDKLVCVILKLMCYYLILVFWNGWVDKPKPEWIENTVAEIMANHSGTLDCVFPEENMLLIFDRGCLNLSVYHPPEKAQRLLEQIAFSEGLFWRKAET